MNLDERIAETVKAAVADALAPYLRRLSDPACLTFTLREAGKVIGCSERTVSRLIADGKLPTVPGLGAKKVQIPRVSVEQYVANAAVSVSLPLEGGAAGADSSVLVDAERAG